MDYNTISRANASFEATLKSQKVITKAVRKPDLVLGRWLLDLFDLLLTSFDDLLP